MDNTSHRISVICRASTCIFKNQKKQIITEIAKKLYKKRQKLLCKVACKWQKIVIVNYFLSKSSLRSSWKCTYRNILLFYIIRILCYSTWNTYIFLQSARHVSWNFWNSQVYGRLSATDYRWQNWSRTIKERSEWLQ